ncbi:MAG: ABC transporter permease [Lachnospiraceae bacterium]|nr:ABC transporter permease [Lachnospiraceae bacterium]
MKMKCRQFFEDFGVTRMIAVGFFLAIAIAVPVLHLNTLTLYSQALTRMAMNGVLVLTMVPIMVCGAGMNFALPIGIICGLIGGLISMNMNLTGFTGFFASILFSIPFSLVMGYLYGLLMNRVKGSEMMIATYVGFAMISAMCIVWLFVPIDNLLLRMQMGRGLRKDVTLTDFWAGILDELWPVTIGGLTIPMGTFLFLFLMCFLVYLYMHSKTGTMMRAAGQNPGLARANGINVDRMRIWGITLSTMLGAVGILVYAQSYGFMQFYESPKMMSFSAVAAVLLGGASNKRASIFNVIFGVMVFQGILTLSMPVANVLLPESNISDIVRMIISNGIILYALGKGSGKK